MTDPRSMRSLMESIDEIDEDEKLEEEEQLEGEELDEMAELDEQDHMDDQCVMSEEENLEEGYSPIEMDASKVISSVISDFDLFDSKGDDGIKLHIDVSGPNLRFVEVHSQGGEEELVRYHEFEYKGTWEKE